MRSATFTDAQRRLLNVIFDHGGRHPTVKTVLGDADAGLDDLKPLIKGEFVRADNDDVSIPAERVQATTEIWLALTGTGGRWVNEGENLFLRVLDESCRTEGKLNLAKAIKAGGNDRVLAALDGGYATIVNDASLRELPPSTSRRRLVTGPNPGRYALVATTKVRQVLGQR